MQQVLILISGLVLGIWVYLVLLHGRYWREKPQPVPAADLKHWPEIAAIVPARNEAPVIGDALASLLRQDYPGKLRIIVVDDQSTDGTAEMAQRAAAERNAEDRLRVIQGAKLPQGWAGKMWAVNQGMAELEQF